MKLILRVLNYEVYHIEDNIFLVASKYKKAGFTSISKKAKWVNDKLVFIDKDFDSSKIPYYFFKRLKEFIPNFLEPFHVYDAVVYKDKEYTIVDTKGKIKIGKEWVDAISYIEKYGKVRFHREKQDFINKFKLLSNN